MTLLRDLGAGYNALCMYRCQQSIACFGRLQPAQRNTGWVLTQLGRAHFEMVDYEAAEAAIKIARRIDPHRLDGLEVYSNLLYHLRKEVELCYLSQQAMELDRRAPQCLCVIGNCFALQKEHETALKFFQRAIQLDPQSPYAHTLAGHEHVANEEFDRGLDYFRAAVRAEPRHYAAWYGLGYVYYRQEKYELAEYHFRRALSINKCSSVLWCYLGLVLAAMKQYDDALDALNEALTLRGTAAPANPLAQYKKACVLVKLGRTAEALGVLLGLRASTPKEPMVQLLLGKVYGKMGEQCEALHHYNLAVFLDPNKVRTAHLCIC
jgi:anaphase-promoting complex subunit 3